MPAATPETCARVVVEVVPMIMRALVGEMRRHRLNDLSVPQFRTLAFINRNEGACLSDAAENFGLTPPSMSKMIDGLVVRGLVLRLTDPRDRRRLTLALTPRGQEALQVAREAAREVLARGLGVLTSQQLATVFSAMETLKPLFDGSRDEQFPAMERHTESSEDEGS